MARPFAITSTADSVRLDARGHGEVAFTISNTSPRDLVARVVVQPLGAAQPAWFGTAHEQEYAIPAGGTCQRTVPITVPAGTATGRFSFRVDAISVENPDEDFVQGPPIAFELAPTAAAPAKPFPWWILIVIGVVLFLAVGVTAALLLTRKPGLGKPCKQGACAKGLVCGADDVCLGDVGFKGCEQGTHCASGLCTDGTCVAKPGLNAACAAGVCADGLVCVAEKCKGQAGFKPCTQGGDCATGTCRDGACIDKPGLDWSQWEDLEGRLTSSPDVASWAPGRLDVFVRGLDNAVWHRAYEQSRGDWTPWDTIGGGTTSDPAAVSWGPQRIDVLARGLDMHLWHRAYMGGPWSNWANLEGVLSSGPAVASWSVNRLDAFVRGMDNALWHKWWHGAAWSAWEPLGGLLLSDPAATSWGPGRLDIFVRGPQDHLWHKWYDGRWSDWEDLGGTLTSGPAAAAWGRGRLDVFARGQAGQLMHKWYDGRWSDWVDVGGQIDSDPAAVSWGRGRIDVFARGLQGQLMHISTGN